MQLHALLAQHFPNIASDRLPSGFDQVGDIAILGMPAEIIPLSKRIGELLLAQVPKLKVVARRNGEYGGEYRLLPLELVAGEKRLTTVHRENGVVLALDLARVYYSVRSAHERARIAALVKPGERVCVLCSGVGPFPLIIARHSHATHVVGIEKNPVAHAYALKNLAANRKLRGVHFYEGDAARVLPGLNTSFDRILIVLPYGGDVLLDCALHALNPGGTLHFYDMQPLDGGNILEKITTAAHRANRRIRLSQLHRSGHCGPHIYRFCLDAVIDA